MCSNSVNLFFFQARLLYLYHSNTAIFTVSITPKLTHSHSTKRLSVYMCVFWKHFCQTDCFLDSGGVSTDLKW